MKGLEEVFSPRLKAEKVSTQLAALGSQPLGFGGSLVLGSLKGFFQHLQSTI
jgi:hypothetical protein